MARYRILTYSNNLFVVQSKFLWFWLTEDEHFDNVVSAKAYVENLKVLAERPKLVNTTYID